MRESNEKHVMEHGIRPRFQWHSAYEVETIILCLRAQLASENASCIGRAKDRYATLFLPRTEQHYWSPQLSLTLETEEKGCLIRGVYGPRPSVWTMFVFFYSLIGFAIMVVGGVGLSNWSLGKSTTILWWLPVLCLLFLSLYLVSYFGQKIGKKQMVVLHRFLKDALECAKEKTKK